MTLAGKRTVVVGGGVGGMASAIVLAARGARVTLIESATRLGGKLAPRTLGGRVVDAGPTVLTMRWVFDDLFEAAGASFSERVVLERADILARHAWQDGTRLDLFADEARSAQAIADAFGAGEAAAFRVFAAKARTIYELVESPFLKSQRPTTADLLLHAGRVGPTVLLRIDAMRSMAQAIDQAFRSPHLRQLFGRYATYVGSSPFEAPATLNLIAHVEQRGVHRVVGGMHRLAEALANLVRELGVEIRLGNAVEHIECTGKRVAAAWCSGRRIPCDALVWNGDVSALDPALHATGKSAAATTPMDRRSLSAVTWVVIGAAAGFPLVHHNVFFGRRAISEFGPLASRQVPEDATVYVCAEDRGDEPMTRPSERFFLVMNAPPTGDDATAWTDEVKVRCEHNAFSTLSRCGLTLHPETSFLTTPADLHTRYPCTGGALYGPKACSPLSALTRQSARTRIEGLYVAGGSVHPGPGVPMAALSGQLAAMQIQADLASMRSSRRADISGITSTR